MQTAIVAVLAFAASFGGGYWLSDTLQENKALRAANAAVVAQKHAEDKLRTALATVDKKHFEELKNARNENDKLRLDLAAGNKRVRVAVRDCKATSTTNMDDATSTAELDGAIAAAITGIANDGDDAIRQLTALQDWAKTVTGSDEKGVIQSHAE